MSISNYSNDEILTVFSKDNDKYTMSRLPDKTFPVYPISNHPILRKSVKKSTYNKQYGKQNLRTEVSFRDLGQLPYSAIVSLTMVSRLDGSFYNGNGVFVGPSHILTSRDNVIQTSSECFADIYVVAGLKANEAIFGFSKVIAFRTFDTNCDNPDLNLALLIIDQPLGKATGWLGMYAFETDKEEFMELSANLTGYQNLVSKMCSESGNVRAKSEIIEHKMFTEDGSSGSPIWLKSNEDYFICGIHIGSWGDVNKACRLSVSKFEFFVENKELLYKTLSFGQLSEDFLGISGIKIRELLGELDNLKEKSQKMVLIQQELDLVISNENELQIKIENFKSKKDEILHENQVNFYNQAENINNIIL